MLCSLWLKKTSAPTNSKFWMKIGFHETQCTGVLINPFSFRATDVFHHFAYQLYIALATNLDTLHVERHQCYAVVMDSFDV